MSTTQTLRSSACASRAAGPPAATVTRSASRVAPGAGRGPAGAGRGRLAGRHQRGSAVAARAVQQPLGLGEVAGHRGAQARAERRGQRQLVARLGAQRVRQRRGPARGSGLRAQELVDLGELGAQPGGLAPGGLGRALALAAGGARRFRGPVGLAARGARALGRLAQALGLGGRGRAPRLELVQLPGELLRAVLGQPLQLGLEAGDALRGPVVAAVGLGVGGERGQQRPAAAGALRERRDRPAGALEPEPDPLVRGAGGVEAAGEPLALVAARRQRALGGLAARGDGRELRLGRGRGGARRGRRGLGAVQRRPGRPGAVARERPARLV